MSTHYLYLLIAVFVSLGGAAQAQNVSQPSCWLKTFEARNPDFPNGRPNLTYAIAKQMDAALKHDLNIQVPPYSDKTLGILAGVYLNQWIGSWPPNVLKNWKTGGVEEYCGWDVCKFRIQFCKKSVKNPPDVPHYFTPFDTIR